MSKLKFANRSIRLPGRKGWRIALGIGLVIGGVLGFLPILGFWMIPLGLIVLSVDLPSVRRWRRRMAVGIGRWLWRRFPSLAQRFGFSARPKGLDAP